MESTVTTQATIYIDNVSPGTIVMLSQSVIPEGWIICDGNNGKKITLSNGTQISVPNLQDKFILGVGSESVNQFGAADSHTHQVTTEKIDKTFNTTSVENHTHLMPQSWYNRSLSCGKHSGIDVVFENVGETATTESGGHLHQVVCEIDAQNLTTTTNKGLRPSWYALYYIMKK